MHARQQLAGIGILPVRPTGLLAVPLMGVVEFANTVVTLLGISDHGRALLDVVV